MEYPRVTQENVAFPSWVKYMYIYKYCNNITIIASYSNVTAFFRLTEVVFKLQ